MSGTYSNLVYHIVFSTKGREPFVTENIREPLYKYIGGIVRADGGVLLEVGGVEDHVHLLAKLKPRISVSQAVRKVKSNSSGWLHEDMNCGHFRWQEGYGAFSVSKSRVEAVRRYIRNQPQHHRRRSYRDEFAAFLDRHEIGYDDRYI